MKFLSMASVLPTVALLLSATSASAAMSGNDLMEYCRGSSDNNQWGFCVGYTVAINDVEQSKTKRGFCIPQTATQGQLARVTTKWMEENPDKLHFAANSLVAAALAQAFPCNK